MLKPGTLIGGKYKILHVIGQGGMSVVYLAVNERANKTWAVKELKQGPGRDREADRKEIEMMKKLRHRRLPCIADVIDGEDSLLIIMDYIEGRSLDQLLAERGPVPQELAVDWARQLCEVLLYLHGQTPPVIYRDMKPANVILKPDGQLMLIDLGAAREYDNRKTFDTVAFGTVGYAAPEQYEENQTDARTDIFCLGVMLFQLLTGENPCRLQPIRRLNPGLSEGLEAVLLRCTQVRKEDRFQDCRELLCALGHYEELGAETRRKYGRRFLIFCSQLFLAAVLSAGSLCFFAGEHAAQAERYQACLSAARNAPDKAAETGKYIEAIRLDPYREEAYTELLEYAFLDDDLLTREESEVLRTVLLEYADRDRTREQIFRKNREGFARFAYRAGLAYFYKYEEKSSKKTAGLYLQAAAEAETLEAPRRERAGRLCLIASYYSRIGRVDAAGDPTVSYGDYWADLVRLTAGNLAEQDNERTALVMYEELTAQILMHCAEFRQAGVKREELVEQLENASRHLRTDFTGLKEERGCLQADIRAARKVVESVFEPGFGGLTE